MCFQRGVLIALPGANSVYKALSEEYWVADLLGKNEDTERIVPYRANEISNLHNAEYSGSENIGSAR